MPICPFSTSPCRMLSKWRAFPTRKFGWTLRSGEMTAFDMVAEFRVCTVIQKYARKISLPLESSWIWSAILKTVDPTTVDVRNNSAGVKFVPENVSITSWICSNQKAKQPSVRRGVWLHSTYIPVCTVQCASTGHCGLAPTYCMAWLAVAGFRHPYSGKCLGCSWATHVK